MKSSEIAGLVIGVLGLALALKQHAAASENVMTRPQERKRIFLNPFTKQGTMTGPSGNADSITTPIDSPAWDNLRQNSTPEYIKNQTAVEIYETRLRNGNVLIESVGSGGNTGQFVYSDTGKKGQGSASGADIYIGSTGKQTPEEATEYALKSLRRIAARDGKAFRNISENQRLTYVKMLGYDPLGKWLYRNGEWLHQ